MNIKNYKYLLVLVLALFIGCKDIYAIEKYCYYKSNDLKVYVHVTDNNKDESNPPYGTIMTGLGAGKNKKVENFMSSGHAGFWGNISFSSIMIGTNGCPQYAVVTKMTGYKLFLTNNMSEITKAGEVAKDIAYATPVSADEFWGQSCNGKECVLGEDITVTCSSLFDSDKKGEESLGSLIKSALNIIRIVVPILIIVLGSLDFGKAVIASKEDEMKKAQTTFIKRLIAGIAVFFVPVIINVVMNLADIVWEGQGYSYCEIKDINK